MAEPGGDNAEHAPGGTKRLQQTQAQVDEVVDIMRVNVEKVLERDDKLDDLQAGAARFEQSAKHLRRKFWWQNMKMWLLIIGIGILLVAIIAIWIASSGDGKSSGGSSSDAPTTSTTTTLSRH